MVSAIGDRACCTLFSLRMARRACAVLSVCVALASGVRVLAQTLPAPQQTVQLSVPQSALQSGPLPAADMQWAPLAELDSEANESAASTRDAAATQTEADDAPRARSSDGSAAGGLSYNGLATIYNGQTLDGLSVEQGFNATPRGAAAGRASAASSFSEGAVRSVRILPHNFSAQYGGVAGGLIVLDSRGPESRAPASRGPDSRGPASRGPESNVHGSALLLERASAWAAANPFSVVTHYRDGVVSSGPVKPAGWLTQIGGTVDAPVVGRLVPARLRGRLAVTASGEVQLHDDSIVSTPAVASFYALSEEQTALLGNRGVSAAATEAALNYLDSLTGETGRLALRLLGSARVDAQLGALDRLTLGYNGEHFDAPAGAALGQASQAVVARGLGSVGDSHTSVAAATMHWEHLFSARFRNHLAGQFAHELEYETPHIPLPQEPAIGPGGYAPQVAIGPNGFAYGTPSSLARVAYPDENRLQLADTAQLRLGKHLLTLGADWSRVHDRIAVLDDAEGAFSYDSGTTNGKDGGLVDWTTDYTFNVNAYPNGGCPSIVAAVHYFCFRSFTQSFGPQQTEFAMHTLAGFAEDAFHARPNLLLTLGARYDYTLLPLPQTPNFTLDSALRALALPLGGATATFPEDRNAFGVRFGADWSPAGFSVRLGYGIFYGRTPGATVLAALTGTAQTSSTLNIRIRPATETVCPQVTNVQQGFGYPCIYMDIPPEAVIQTTSATLFAQNYRMPYVQRASLSVEHKLQHNMELRLNYAMAIATRLPNSVDLNIAPSPALGSFVLQGGDGHPGSSGGDTFVVPLYTSRLLTQYGPVTALVSNANATYHAATVETRLHPAGWLQLRGSYTFSRAIDYGPQSGAKPQVNGQFDPFNHGYDKGLSDQQFPQRFAGDMVFEPHIQQGPQLLRRAADGWHLAAIAVAGSGAPYSYEIFGGTYLSGGRETINGSGGATYLPTVGRNTLRLPARGRVDIKLSRDVTAGRTHIEGFAEAFNLLNMQSISAVQTRAFLPGTPTATGTPAPLVFQDASAITTEGLSTTLPFGTPLSSTTGLSRERELEVGARVRF